MAIYSQSHLGTITTINAACYDILASAFNPPKVYEFSLNEGTAVTGLSYGLGRPANDGAVVQTTGLLFQAENAGDPPAQTKGAIAWSTAPTIPTNFLRRFWPQNLAGIGMIWTFPRGLVLPVGKGVALFNLTAGTPTLAVGGVIDE